MNKQLTNFIKTYCKKVSNKHESPNSQTRTDFLHGCFDMFTTTQNESGHDYEYMDRAEFIKELHDHGYETCGYDGNSNVGMEAVSLVIGLAIK